MIHAVGEKEYGLYIDLEEHSRLVDFLGEKQKDIWTAPVFAKYLKAREQKPIP